MGKGFSEQELYEIEVAIYNDDNETLFKSLPEGIEDHNDGETVKELAQGQEYYIIPDSNLMIRQDGRLFNARYIRTVKPMWTPYDFIVNINGKQTRYRDVYKEMGWKFDHTNITKNFITNDWGVSVTRAYKPVFKDFIADD